MPEQRPLRIAALGDLHYSRHSKGEHRELLMQAAAAADVIVICGDLTDYGLVEEAQLLEADLQHCDKPVIAVLGNHDFESGHHEELIQVLEHGKVNVLDGECMVIDGVGFAGVCGFGGGFGRRMLNAWGEAEIKRFVQEAVDQAMRLERALARLDTPSKIALLHYAPIRDTVVGEDPEIFPFMGSTRLEGPINRFSAVAAFHGHAHGGSPQGVTSTGIPVFNVSVPLLKKLHPDKPAFKIFEVHRNGVSRPHVATTPKPKKRHEPAVAATLSHAEDRAPRSAE